MVIIASGPIRKAAAGRPPLSARGIPRLLLNTRARFRVSIATFRRGVYRFGGTPVGRPLEAVQTRLCRILHARSRADTRATVETAA